MDQFRIYDIIEDLRKEGKSFCVSTVIRTADTTSAKAGCKAVVTSDGDIYGHVGGNCVQSALRKAGLAAMEIGKMRMIRIKPAACVDSLHDNDGVRIYKSGCPSGGTVDLLIEPCKLAPVLVVYGNTPIGRAIAEHGKMAGYRVVTSREMGFAGGFHQFDGATANVQVTSGDFAVVASQGIKDLEYLRAALASPARRVSMVASRRKAAALMTTLIAEGMDKSSVERLKSPAGIDLKGIDPHEIALSVLAEIVLWRNSDRSMEIGEFEVAS
ncbi:MAG: XdhC family protein [Roseovarius sp.]|nr:XdhC family protein [Roseovarius sp.]MCY4209318.1 XdhC family protein [Roseovarius sp.]MCY4292706.1 XdhC family protein [Roseovarius sp.]